MHVLWCQGQVRVGHLHVAHHQPLPAAQGVLDLPVVQLDAVAQMVLQQW